MQVIVRRADLGEQQPNVLAFFPDSTDIRSTQSYGDGITIMTVPDNAVLPAPPGLPGGHVLAANWRSFPNVVVNAEANRRVQISFPDYMQRNANQDQTKSITSHGADTSQWPQDALDRKASADAGWNFVNAVREVSDAMIGGMPLDPTDDAHWPIQIPPVYIPPQ
jgi:hypothetical protein